MLPRPELCCDKFLRLLEANKSTTCSVSVPNMARGMGGGGLIKGK